MTLTCMVCAWVCTWCDKCICEDKGESECVGGGGGESADLQSDVANEVIFYSIIYDEVIAEEAC